MQITRTNALALGAQQTRVLLRNVYLWMSGGLTITGFAALFMASNRPLLTAFAQNPLLFIGLVVFEIFIIISLTRRIRTMSVPAATLAFAFYALLNGITLSPIFLIYTGISIAKTFFITAGTFAATSLWAMSTKKDLSGLGHFFFMGLIGLIIASVVNLFLRSQAFDYVISFVGVILFVGLTAYDTQQIKRQSNELAAETSADDYTRLSIIGALRLYLDFINLFIFLLRFTGRD